MTDKEKDEELMDKVLEKLFGPTTAQQAKQAQKEKKAKEPEPGSIEAIVKSMFR